MTEPLASWICSRCGMFNAVENNLCPACAELLTLQISEEAAARWTEIDREIRSRINCIVADAEIGDEDATEDNTSYLVDYVLGLLK